MGKLQPGISKHAAKPAFALCSKDAGILRKGRELWRQAAGFRTPEEEP